MTKSFRNFLGAAIFGLPVIGMALESDQIRGEVVSVDAEARQIEVRILEAGDRAPGREGQTEEYDVPAGLEIEYEIDSSIFSYYRDDPDGLEDIVPGDRVVIGFDEIGERRQARQVRSEYTSNSVARDRAQREGRLVATTDVENDVENTFDRGSEIVAANDDFTRTSLPRTASMLPAVGLLGLVFALFGTLLRCCRTRA